MIVLKHVVGKEETGNANKLKATHNGKLNNYDITK
jgi:hypothetical protein